MSQRCDNLGAMFFLAGPGGHALVAKGKGKALVAVLIVVDVLAAFLLCLLLSVCEFL